MVPRAIRIGEDLTNAKELVGHGSFLKWVKLNCAMSDKNAERYMHLAANKEKLIAELEKLENEATDKFDMLSNLSLAQAHRLVDGGGGTKKENASDAYDRAEGRLIDKLEGLSIDVAEAAAAETIRRLNLAIETKKTTLRKAS